MKPLVSPTHPGPHPAGVPPHCLGVPPIAEGGEPPKYQPKWGYHAAGEAEVPPRPSPKSLSHKWGPLPAPKAGSRGDTPRAPQTYTPKRGTPVPAASQRGPGLIPPQTQRVNPHPLHLEGTLVPHHRGGRPHNFGGYTPHSPFPQNPTEGTQPVAAMPPPHPTPPPVGRGGPQQGRGWAHAPTPSPRSHRDGGRRQRRQR